MFLDREDRSLLSPHRLTGVVVGLALLAASCSTGSDIPGGGAEGTGEPGADPESTGYPYDMGPLKVLDGTLVDQSGRQFMLRGAAVNSLSDYYQADPELPTVLEHDDSDWDLMAEQGFSSTRVSVSWSRIEPERGEYDAGYIDEIGRFIDEAAKRGIYTVLDVHQMAWGKYIATPDDIECPDGTERAIGWEGAPPWATLFDDASTCREPGVRELSDAVQESFKSFYENRDGIRDAYAAMWAHLVVELGDRTGLAGYDLMNEPFPAPTGEDTEALYTDFVLDVIAAIRVAETEIGVPEAPVFIEPMVLAPLPGNRLQSERFEDRNLVYSPHVYPFGGLSAEQVFEAHAATAEEIGLPLWIGEYYLGADSPEKLEQVATLLDAMDDRLSNWVWWTWQVACGDPHFNQAPRDQPKKTKWYHLMTTSCPSGEHEPTTAALELVNRGYPRAAPGRLSLIESDPGAGTLTVAAEGAPIGEELVAWLPPASGNEPSFEGTTGLSDIEVHEVPGGSVVTANTDAPDYVFVVAP